MSEAVIYVQRQNVRKLLIDIREPLLQNMLKMGISLATV